jgi:hypothetical protein
VAGVKNVKEIEMSPEGTMPRIAIVGNCQALGLADVIKFLLPNAFIKPIISWEAQNWVSSYEAFVDDLRTFDVVFSHDVTIGNFSDASLHSLRRDVEGVIQVPIIVFPAFHPDLVYASVKTEGGVSSLQSPIGAYNSAIALVAYLRNYSLPETLRLFSAPVYERLGYFDFWETSCESLLATGRECGIDLRDHLARWTRGGCFMHSINHAKIEILGDLALAMLRKAGVRTHENNWRPFVSDPGQLDAIWPIYPEIGEKFGLPGCYVFKRPDYAAKGQQAFLTLDAFVVRSFESYRFFPQARISCDRVDKWLEDKDLIEFLDRTAAGK